MSPIEIFLFILGVLVIIAMVYAYLYSKNMVHKNPFLDKHLLKKGMVFGKDILIELFLYDIPEKENKLKAFSLELEDCCFKNIIKININ